LRPEASGQLGDAKRKSDKRKSVARARPSRRKRVSRK
jgi:hypothetical protein